MIALAHERRCRIILDNRKARAVAVRLGVLVTGTVGLLLKEITDAWVEEWRRMNRFKPTERSIVAETALVHVLVVFW